MRVAWTSNQPGAELLVVENTILVRDDKDVVGLDDHGVERWRHAFDRRPYHFTRCGSGVTVTLPDRWAATQIVTLDLEGKQRWRYDREWGLLFRGIDGDARGVVLHGQDFGGEGVNNHWVGLDAETGAVTFERAPPVNASPECAGAWLHAPINDGTEGILRTDRDGSHPITLTTLDYWAAVANDEVLVVDTGTDVIAIELATCRERWRAPGGRNLEIAIDNRRAAWVDGSGHPVVYELATGKQMWRGAAMPPLRSETDYRCKLGPHALVCYGGFSTTAYYSLASATPLHATDERGDGAFFGEYFLDLSGDHLVCLELA